MFFRNLHTDAYTDSDAVGVTKNGGSNLAKRNVVIPGANAGDAPIAGITRGALFTSTEGKKILPVVFVDPRARKQARKSAHNAPKDGFFTPVLYRAHLALRQTGSKAGRQRMPMV
ncbi:MAG: hypothetical protein U0586_11975 [Candidatus Brocadiaceae bacterium]